MTGPHVEIDGPSLDLGTRIQDRINPFVNVRYAVVSHAIRQTAASDRGGLAGEVVSDRPSDGGSLEVVSALFAGLGQVAGVKGCGGTAARARAVLDQHLARLALEPLPSRRAPPKQITASSD